MSTLLDVPEFLDALPGLLMPDQGSQARIPMLTRRLEEIARLIES